MYILKNSLISIFRNKGRNILIGIIILVISCASTITLAIRNTAQNIVKDYEAANDIVATLSLDRSSMSSKFKGGSDAMKENIEAFNNIGKISIDDVKKYGESENLKGYYYTYSTSLNSDTLTKASDSYQYEVESSETSTKTSTSSSSSGGSSGSRGGPGGMPGGMDPQIIYNQKNIETTTVITKSMETFQSNKKLTGDFQLDGYSSYDAMTDFVSGNMIVSEGNMISDFNSFECVVNSELATLNEISVGSTIQLKNATLDKTYDFTVVGIYKDNSKLEDTVSMYSSSANTIIVGSGLVEQLVSEDETLTTNISSSFVVKDEESIEKFSQELKDKGLSEYYTVSTNIDDIKNATKSISNVETFATTFLLITLAISAVVLLVINMINIRERKYEIGVFRTIGVSKFKLTIKFVFELLIVSVIMLFIGAGIGAYFAKPVGNYLLESEISKVQESEEEVTNNFGPNMGGKGGFKMDFNKSAEIASIDSIDAVVNYVVILQLLGIGIALTFVSSIASMISIQRFSPLTILKERS